jgi:hypothetical protein
MVVGLGGTFPTNSKHQVPPAVPEKSVRTQREKKRQEAQIICRESRQEQLVNKHTTSG